MSLTLSFIKELLLRHTMRTVSIKNIRTLGARKQMGVVLMGHMAMVMTTDGGVGIADVGVVMVIMMMTTVAGVARRVASTVVMVVVMVAAVTTVDKLQHE